MRKRSGPKHRLVTGTLLALALVSTLTALSHDEMRQPVVRFIDFYLASEQADAPRMSLLERVIYGLVAAKTPDEKQPAVDAPGPGGRCPASENN